MVNMTNRIFIPIRCKECGVIIGAYIYPSEHNTTRCYCFDCTYSFIMVNEVLGTKFSQSVKQFFSMCEITDYMDYLIQTGDSHLVQWLHRIKLWHRNETNVSSETEID